MTLASFVLVAAVLYFAKVVFIPVAVAALLTFLLAPLVLRLQRCHFPKPVAILTTVVLAFGLIGITGWLVTTQLMSLAEQLPRYEQTLHAKVAQLRGAKDRPSALKRAGDLVQTLKKEFEAAPTNTVAQTLTTNDARVSDVVPPQPIPVQIKAGKPGGFSALRQIVGPFLGILGTGGIVALFTIAMLFQREDLRDRFIRLVSNGSLNVATEAIDDAARRISRYLGMQLVVNATYGLPIGIGLYFIGVPNAFLWGLLATLLRFIPFLGPWIAAAFPLALAFAVDPGWSKVFLALGLFLVIELISNNVVEPWLYGASTGISNVALMVAAVFWTWLWGTMGLFLSTPLTVCLIVMGKYVPGLQFLSVLLGSAPVMEPQERLYQRMLAMDHDEMLALAKNYLETHCLVEFYDEVLIPALSAAEQDRHNGTLAEVRQQFILQHTRELIDELGELHRRAHGDVQGFLPESGKLLVVPAKDDVDEVAATILAQLCKLDGITTQLLSSSTLPSDCFEITDRERFGVVCISAVPPAALHSVRELCVKLSDRCPEVKIIAGIWNSKAAVTELTQRLATRPSTLVVTTMRDAKERFKALLEEGISEPMTPAPIPPDESERLEEVERLHLTDREPDEMFDAVTRQLASVFNVPISLVSIIDADRQFWKSQVGLPEDLAVMGEAPRETSVCGHVVASNAPLVLNDVAKDKRFANNPFLQSRGIRFYAGVPLRTKTNHAVGSLCGIDTKPREASEREIALLSLLADKLMEAIESRKLKPLAK